MRCFGESLDICSFATRLSGAETLTLVLASFFIVGGLFRAIGSGMAKFPRWGWAVFSGIVSVVLGVMLLRQIPISGIWFIGFAIGVDLICDGVAVTSFATAIHQFARAGRLSEPRKHH